MVSLSFLSHVSKLKKLRYVEELLKNEKTSNIDEGTMSQSMCSALQLSLIELLRSWGLRPSKVVGHSSGEIAASYAIGALDFENCLKVAYYRGVSSSELAKSHPNLDGAMLAVGASPELVSSILESVTDGKVVIACFNSPSNITVSGDSAAIEQLHRILTDRGLFSRKLRVAHAYHSHHMAFVQTTYRRLLGRIDTTNDFEGEMWSSVTAKRINPKTLNGEYWVNNLLAPVKFSQALGGLLETCTGDVVSLVEVGPHSALRGPIETLLASVHKSNDKAQVSYSPTLVRFQSAAKTLLDLAGKLFCQGHKISMSAVNIHHKLTSKDVLTDLPPYVWNHTQRFWHSSRYARDYLNRPEGRSDFLGVASPDSSSLEPRWRNVVNLSEIPWVQDHVIQSQIVYPAAGYITMAIEGSLRIAAAKNISASFHMIREMSIVKALVIPEKGEAIETAISFRPYNESHRSWSEYWHEFRISSWTSEASWTEHCRGLVLSQTEIRSNEVDSHTTHQEQGRTDADSRRAAEEACTETIDVDQFYRQLSTIGMEFGPTFKRIKKARTGKLAAIGHIFPSDTASRMPYGFESSHVIHPATLDSIFQTTLLALSGKVKLVSRPLVLTFIEEFTISGSTQGGHQGWNCHTVALPRGSREVVASLTAHQVSPLGLMLQVKGLRGTLLEPEEPSAMEETSQHRVCKVLWKLDVDLSPEASFGQKLESSARTGAQSWGETMGLEQAARTHIVKALRRTDDKDIDPNRKHLVKLYHWMKAQQDAEIPLKSSKLDQHHSHDESGLLGEEGLLLDRIGNNLDRILKGLVEPLSLIIEDNLLDRYYASKPVLTSAYINAANYIKNLSHKKPDMQILEVGAGTGSTTLPLLQALGGLSGVPPRFTRYMFTDVSTTFIEQARRRFHNWGKLVEFGKLNIEINPYMQGFSPGSYDLIIAANVLHATSEMERTLKNVRSLLKPGGKLLLIEMTKDMLHLHLVWGTLPGWWYGKLLLLRKPDSILLIYYRSRGLSSDRPSNVEEKVAIGPERDRFLRT